MGYHTYVAVAPLKIGPFCEVDCGVSSQYEQLPDAIRDLAVSYRLVIGEIDPKAVSVDVEAETLTHKGWTVKPEDWAKFKDLLPMVAKHSSGVKVYLINESQYSGGGGTDLSVFVRYPKHRPALEKFAADFGIDKLGRFRSKIQKNAAVQQTL